MSLTCIFQEKQDVSDILSFISCERGEWGWLSQHLRVHLEMLAIILSSYLHSGRKDLIWGKFVCCFISQRKKTKTT